MYIDIGETVRVCVEEEVFEESEPGPIIGATAAGAGGLPGAVVAAQAEKVEDGTRVAPYRITVSRNELGVMHASAYAFPLTVWNGERGTGSHLVVGGRSSGWRGGRRLRGDAGVGSKL